MVRLQEDNVSDVFLIMEYHGCLSLSCVPLFLIRINSTKKKHVERSAARIIPADFTWESGMVRTSVDFEKSCELKSPWNTFHIFFHVFSGQKPYQFSLKKSHSIIPMIFPCLMR